MTGNVLLGGDRPLPTSPPGRELDQRLCELFDCLLSEGALERWMAQSGIDPEVLRACLRAWCEKGASLSEEELRAREGTTREISRAPAAPAGIDPRLVDQLVGLVANRIAQARPEPEPPKGHEPTPAPGRRSRGSSPKQQ